MKRLLLLASCASLVFSTIAPSLADAQNNGPASRPSPSRPMPSRPMPTRPMPSRPMPIRPMPGRPGGDHPSSGRPSHPGWRPGRPDHRPPTDGRPHHPGWRPPHHHPGWRPPHHHPGWRPPHHGFRPGWGWNGHRIHAGFFRYPAGYGYRTWSVGATLPALFLTSAYFFNDFATIGLDAPPYGYQWVRYGPDALLVNMRTGRIEAVERGVFY